MALLQISEPGKTQAPHEKKFFIGIDLGTTNSLVALIQNGSPTVLTDINEKELIAIMRNNLKKSSFKLWRERVSGRKTKHLKLRENSVDRFKCKLQRNISNNKISKR